MSGPVPVIAGRGVHVVADRRLPRSRSRRRRRRRLRASAPRPGSRCGPRAVAPRPAPPGGAATPGRSRSAPRRRPDRGQRGWTYAPPPRVRRELYAGSLQVLGDHPPRASSAKLVANRTGRPSRASATATLAALPPAYSTVRPSAPRDDIDQGLPDDQGNGLHAAILVEQIHAKPAPLCGARALARHEPDVQSALVASPEIFLGVFHDGGLVRRAWGSRSTAPRVSSAAASSTRSLVDRRFLNLSHRRPEPGVDLFLLRTRSRRLVGIGHQLDHGHGRVVALARTDLGDPGVAARALSERGPISVKSTCTTVLSRMVFSTSRRLCRSPRFALVISLSAYGRSVRALASVVVIRPCSNSAVARFAEDQPLVGGAAAEAGALLGVGHCSLASPRPCQVPG